MPNSIARVNILPYHMTEISSALSVGGVYVGRFLQIRAIVAVRHNPQKTLNLMAILIIVFKNLNLE